MSWTGALYKTARNDLTFFCTEHARFAIELTDAVPDKWDLLFAVNGPDRQLVESILQAVFSVARCVQVGIPPVPHGSDVLSRSGDTYIYAYFHEELPQWQQCFYIGKGTFDLNATHAGRWTDHVQKTAETPVARQNAKMRQIQAWIETRGLVGVSSSKLRRAAAGSLVRKIASFTGPNANAQAYYAEYFLISHGVGAHNVANDTNGNANSYGCSAITRPSRFDRQPLEELIWDGTVDCFIASPHSPSLSSKWRPAALTVLAWPFVQALNEHVAQFGLSPHPMTGLGRLSAEMMVGSNLQVAGAADAIFTYSIPARQEFRIELRIGATRFETSISLRPYGNDRAAQQVFLQYMDQGLISLATIPGYAHSVPGVHGHPVKNRERFPYYKPYALSGKGHNSAWFDFADPLQPSQVSANWIQGLHCQLNLVQAMQLIAQAF